MCENKYAFHTVGIFALFLLGEAGIIIPFYNSNEKTFLSFLIAALISLFIIIYKYFFTENFFDKNDNLYLSNAINK